MSRFSGKQYKGASRDAREVRKLEAEERNSRTPLHLRRAYRRSQMTPSQIVMAMAVEMNRRIA